MTLSEYLARLIRATIILAVLGALGGAGIVLMWQYVANASETWDYFPRGMYIIPASVSIIWGGVTLGMAWFWINALFNTEYARVGPIDEATDRLDSHTREEEADRMSARKALIEQTEQAGHAMGTKEAEELRVWLNDRGISDSEIIEYDMNDLLEETRSGEAENDDNPEDD